MRLLDGALLETAADAVLAAIDDGSVLVAIDADRVVGACVLDESTDPDGTHVEAIAVSRRRRRRGVGTALVRAAAARQGRLVADFDARARPFWRSLGFRVRPADEPGRFVGSLGPPTE